MSSSRELYRRALGTQTLRPIRPRIPRTDVVVVQLAVAKDALELEDACDPVEAPRLESKREEVHPVDPDHGPRAPLEYGHYLLDALRVMPLEPPPPVARQQNHIGSIVLAEREWIGRSVQPERHRAERDEFEAPRTRA